MLSYSLILYPSADPVAQAANVDALRYVLMGPSPPARVTGTSRSNLASLIIVTSQLPHSFILANTEELHERIGELQERIAHLEGGLQALHQKTNSGERNEPHPLLTDDLLNIKTPIGAEIVGSANPRLRRRTRSPEASAGVGEGDNSEELTESFGTLALAEDSGKSRFFGTAAGAQFLLGVSHIYSFLLFPL
jgi:hypothetical protein